MQEGYTKYQLVWEKGPAPEGPFLVELIRWRQRMYAAGLIGYDSKQQVGFGNISFRPHSQQKAFVISGTQTGSISRLTPLHFTTVVSTDIPQNKVYCQGPIAASSESLTHAAVYALSHQYRAVIHVHHLPMWQYFQDRLPTSDPAVPYGTPEMAMEVKRLYQESELPSENILIMGGHEEGILAMGDSLTTTGELLLSWKKIWENRQ